jgi:hypothetical protein
MYDQAVDILDQIRIKIEICVKYGDGERRGNKIIRIRISRSRDFFKRTLRCKFMFWPLFLKDPEDVQL